MARFPLSSAVLQSSWFEGFEPYILQQMQDNLAQSTLDNQVLALTSALMAEACNGNQSADMCHCSAHSRVEHT